MTFRGILSSLVVTYYYVWLLMGLAYRRKCLRIERRLRNRERRMENLNELIRETDRKCISELRMDRRTFFILCEMLRDVGGLKATRNMTIEEIVAHFLYTLAHHLKNRTIGRFFFRSGETVSRQFNLCLLAVLKLQHLLLKTPEPIPENSTDNTWKNFKNCLGALDGTAIKNNPDAKGLYGVSFPYYDELSMVYSKDMATGEGAEDMTDAVQNLEEELVRVNANDEEDGEDMTSVETPRRSVDSTSSSSKKRKKEWKGKKTSSSDPLLDVFNEVSGDLKVATMSIGKMAQAMDREASNQEKARDEDPQQKLREKAINEVRRLEFTGSEVIKAAGVFVRMPDQMGMLFALPEPLRREYIVDMLRDEAARRERERSK
ncbi:uncharacterized protein [Zea mays]|uniref:Uncharacterized protein n=2 Tax=Zea mays TaxID=4577 RepID=A0A804MNQ6_MAIZE|nr:uncharacterized protein LOC103647471 isoform X1 [Zea mays]|eukprot:XP_008670228.1 uncharacterized protein LOC103647471 isoform X1 [Zea mays]